MLLYESGISAVSQNIPGRKLGENMSCICTLFKCEWKSLCGVFCMFCSHGNVQYVHMHTCVGSVGLVTQIM